MEKLKAEEKDWEKKIKEQHKKMGGVHMSAVHTAKVQKNVRTLENRLDKVIKYDSQGKCDTSIQKDYPLELPLHTCVIIWYIQDILLNWRTKIYELLNCLLTAMEDFRSNSKKEIK